jgi:hypothetical protein
MSVDPIAWAWRALNPHVPFPESLKNSWRGSVSENFEPESKPKQPPRRRKVRLTSGQIRRRASMQAAI